MEATIAPESTPTSERRLSPFEAESLWRAWQSRRDVSARDRLVLSYSPMVKYLAARKVRELPAHCELEDLVSCGLLALIGAVDRFDPSKGATFEQYAWTRVSGAIMDELRRQDWASRSTRRFAREAERARDRWLARSGRLPNEAELAGEMKVDVDELRERLEELDRANLVSLNAPARGIEEALPVELGDTLETPSSEFDPEAATLAGERSAIFRAAIASLSERERNVLTLVHVHHLGGAEVGRILGVSESRVSQILSSIRRKLSEQIQTYDRVECTA